MRILFFNLILLLLIFFFFFFNDTATTEIYTLSLHDALPISAPASRARTSSSAAGSIPPTRASTWPSDRKSTRLNSSHLGISYAVFCLKKKKKKIDNDRIQIVGTQTCDLVLLCVVMYMHACID